MRAERHGDYAIERGAQFIASSFALFGFVCTLVLGLGSRRVREL